MTTATKAKAAGKRTKAKSAAKRGAEVVEPEPTLFQQLKEGLEDFRRHLAGEDVGVVTTVRPTPPFAQCLAELKEAREAAGLTLAQVSARSGLRVETLSRLELGKVPNPTVATLAKYAAGVGRVLTLGSVPQNPPG